MTFNDIFVTLFFLHDDSGKEETIKQNEEKYTKGNKMEEYVKQNHKSELGNAAQTIFLWFRGKQKFTGKSLRVNKNIFYVCTNTNKGKVVMCL